MTSNLVNKQHEVCFTGFSDAKEAELKAWAEASGMTPRTNVTRKLTHLICSKKYIDCGEHYGKTKKRKAWEQNCKIIILENCETQNDWKAFIKDSEAFK